MVPSRITPSRRDNRIGWKLLREPTLTVCLRDLKKRKRAAASPDVAVLVPRRTISRGGIYGTKTTVRFIQPSSRDCFCKLGPGTDERCNRRQGESAGRRGCTGQACQSRTHRSELRQQTRIDDAPGNR